MPDRKGVGSIESDVGTLISGANDTQRRLGYLLEKTGAEDPIAKEAKERLAAELTRHFEKKPGDLTAVAEGNSIQLRGSYAAELTQKQINDALTEVALEFFGQGKKNPRADSPAKRNQDGGAGGGTNDA